MTPQEVNEEAYKLIKLLYDRYKADNPEQVTRLFVLHNYIFPDKPEYGKSCGSCVKRVMNKMKEHYDNVLKPMFENK